ncbi:MAG TPA: hypothetical protein ENN01_01605 [Halothiobacillus sp.]|nr:hypothetical protein [Halothiobacillus sp.]
MLTPAGLVFLIDHAPARVRPDILASTPDGPPIALSRTGDGAPARCAAVVYRGERMIKNAV